MCKMGFLISQGDKKELFAQAKSSFLDYKLRFSSTSLNFILICTHTPARIPLSLMLSHNYHFCVCTFSHCSFSVSYGLRSSPIWPMARTLSTSYSAGISRIWRTL